MISPNFSVNAWREMLARIFGDLRAQDNVSPDWLINPATKRRLKLDKFYPDIGIAIRFIGLTAKGQGRQSDWEMQETENRDDTREELCRQHNVELVRVDSAEDIIKQLDTLSRALTRASRLVSQSERPFLEKQRLMPILNNARTLASDLRARISQNPEQMITNLASSWRDRENGFALPGPSPSVITETKPKSNQPLAPLSENQRVRHERFGEGVITALIGTGSEQKVSILFDGAQERTFLRSLIQDKLEIL